MVSIFAGYELHVPVTIKDVFEIRERVVLNARQYYEEIPQPIKDKYAEVVNISVPCPANSVRNPYGLPDYYSNHLIEYGPLYHTVVPDFTQEWKTIQRSLQVFRANESGE